MTDIEALLPELTFEYWFINDGSKDNTLNLLKEISKQSEQYNYLSFLEISEKRLLFMLV